MADDTMLNGTQVSEAQVEAEGLNHQEKMAVIGMLSFFTVVGSVGNSMVLYVYSRKRNKLASTIFIITLAGTDLMTCVIIIPYTMTAEYLDYVLQYDLLCKAYMFLITSNVPFSAFIMGAIAVDRYLCICHPFMHLLNAKRAKCVIFILGLTAVILGIITALCYKIHRPEPVINGVHHLSDDTADITDKDNIHIDGIVLFKAGSSITKHSPVYNSTLSENARRVENSNSNTTDHQFSFTNGQCVPYSDLFSEEFVNMYQKIYSSFFVIVIVIVIVLYVMIYRFVSVRRAKRQRMRSQRSGYASAETRVSISNGCAITDVCDPPRKAETQTIREKGLVANVRTAGMLFVVTAVFIIVFLPAWLMAHEVIPFSAVIFYCYFFYNVANPIVYAFMNKSFRRNLKDVFECRPILY